MLFEKNTEKWFRLYESLYGFKKFNNNLDGLKKDFKLYYPNKRKNSLSFGNILNVIPLCKGFDIYWLMEKLNRKRTMVYSYINRLEKWKVLNSKYYKKGKIYKLNKELPNIRR